MRPDVNKLWNPSGLAYGNARTLAKLYGLLANGGSYQGKSLMSPSTIAQLTRIIKGGIDKSIKLERHYGFGFCILQSPKVLTISRLNDINIKLE